MAARIKTQAFRIAQPTKKGQAIYVTSLEVGDLIDETQFKIDFWDPKKKESKGQGYQRLPSGLRAVQIARYIQEDSQALFPSMVLINSREPLIFTQERVSPRQSGELVLNNFPMWIVDGQHRIAGFRYAIEKLGLKDWKKVEIPVIILSNFGREEEISQFYLLNTTQKRVATDLAQRLISDIVRGKPKEYESLVSKGKDWELRALKVTDLLNEKDGSIWKGSIRLPNSEKKASYIVNQNSFVKSLQPIFKDGLLSSIRDADRGYEIIKNYWIAVKKIFPDAFRVPREYVIQKTPGIFSLHALAHRILIRGGEGKTSEKDFMSVLEEVFPEKKYTSDFWRADGGAAALYGSMKGFRILADEFTSGLPE